MLSIASHASKLAIPRGPAGSVCLKCLVELSLPARRGLGRSMSAAAFRGGTKTGIMASLKVDMGVRSGRFGGIGCRTQSTASVSKVAVQFFASNTFPKDRKTTVVEPTVGVPNGSSEAVDINTLLPHRRRAARKQGEATAAAATVIPPDASSILSTESQALPSTSFKRTFFTYLSLSKPRLTALIVLTTMASYALYPLDPLLSPSATEAPSLSALTLIYLTSGTALSSASANAFNMLLEPKFDSQMSRTRNRPLVRGLLSKRQALVFAIATGLAGVTLLYYGVNPTVSGLSALNIFLYAGIYTPMKRVSVLNTWAGAVVGGIPPLMGWAAASGASAVEGSAWELLSHPGGWLLAGLLFAWQFPHFNALSWTIREEYRRAGYVMAAWKYPALNARVALRYSVLFFPLCFGLTYYGVTDSGFLLTSSAINAWGLREAWRFYKQQTPATARGLFWASVWHLPVVMGLAMVHKKGVWSGLWARIKGDVEE